MGHNNLIDAVCVPLLLHMCATNQHNRSLLKSSCIRITVGRDDHVDKTYGTGYCTLMANKWCSQQSKPLLLSMLQARIRDSWTQWDGLPGHSGCRIRRVFAIHLALHLHYEFIAACCFGCIKGRRLSAIAP